MPEKKRINYWQQEATPWVSTAVLAGGLATALILLFLVNIENKVYGISAQAEQVEFKN